MTDDSRFDKLELDRGNRARPGSSPGEPPPQSPHKAAEPAPAGEHPRRLRAPGSPEEMTQQMQLQLEPLFNGRQVKVRQFRERLEMLLGWQQANRYEVSSEEGRPMFWAAEQANGLLGSLSRNFNPFYRNTTDCVMADGTLAMRITFPFTWFFRRGQVTAWDGRALGATVQRFSLLRSRIDVLGTNDNVLLEISGPFLKFFSFTPWVFEVRQHGKLVAAIRKHWSGWFQELFSRADNFTIDFEPGFSDPRLRQLLVAAALTIDLVNFEQKDRHLSGSDVIQRLLE